MSKYLLIFLIFIFTLQAQDVTNKKEVTLVLPWKHQFQFAGYYMAKQKGFYKEAGLIVDIKEYDLKRDITKDVASGKYDFGVGHSSLIFEKLTQYNNIIFLNAILQSSPFVLISTKYKKLEDIVSKRVMMSNDQTTTASINAMLHSKNLTKDSFIAIDTSFNPMDLLSSNADFMSAYLSNEPYTLSQKGIEYFVINPKDYGYDFYSDILFTSKEMILNNQADVDKFKVASLKGWKYAFENIDETIDIILKHYNTQNRTKKALEYEANVLKKLAFKRSTNFGDINHLRIREIATTYRLLGLLKAEKNVDFTQFTYQSKNDFTFLLKEEKSTDYFNFINNVYFKFILLLLFLVFLIGTYFRVRMGILLKQKTEQLKIKNKIFNTNICSSTTNIHGKITSVSDAFCESTGYSREELLSQSHSMLSDKNTAIETYKNLWMSISSGHSWRGEFKNRKKDGSEYWVSIIISPVFDNKSNIISYESILQDITLKKVLENFNSELEAQVKEKTKKLEILAKTDKLTGIFNRVKLDDDLELNYNYFKEFGENFSVIIIDIDKFKDVNDTHGHQVGDIILQELSGILRETIRSTDMLGRWGGEEFLVICPKSDIKNCFNLAQKLRGKIESYDFSRVHNITISSGVCDIESAKDIDTMVNYADMALYDAKRAGRNRVFKYGDK